MDELDEFFKGDEQPVEAEAETQEPKATEQPQEAETQPSGQPRDEAGKFKAKGEEAAPPADEEKAKTGQEAAIVAERRKRQEAQERIERLERQLQELQQVQQPQEPQQPPPTIWDDDQAWQQHFGGQVINTAVEQATFKSKLDMSEMMARQAHSDFDEVWEPMNEFLNNNPALIQKATASAHPWDHAYKAFKNYQTMQELGATDMDSLKAQLLEQLKQEQAQAKPATPSIPQSLAGEQSARGSAASPQSPPSLDDILKG